MTGGAEVRISRWSGGIRRQWPFGLVLVIFVGGFLAGVLWPQHWLRAVSIMSFALGVGAVLRLLLPPVRAGWLVVRSRFVDVVCFAVLSVGTFTFGVLVHH